MATFCLRPATGWSVVAAPQVPPQPIAAGQDAPSDGRFRALAHSVTDTDALFHPPAGQRWGCLPSRAACLSALPSLRQKVRFIRNH